MFNPNELKYDTSETCDPSEQCIDCIIRSMRNSYEGRLLASNQPRYEDFWGGKKSTWEDLERFKRFMGNDVDPVLHGPHQAEFVAIPMITAQNAAANYQPFTREEGKLLVIAHCFHDLHEGLTGDIAYPDKTNQTYEDELEVNLECVQKVMFLPADDDFLRRYRGVVGDLEGWSFAGRAFSAGEWCGYFLTGLRAWSMRKHMDLSDDERQAAEIMGREVTLSIIKKVAQAADEFVYCRELLDRSAYALEEMQK